MTRNKAIDRLRALQRKSRLVTEAAPEIEAQMGRAEASAEQRAISGETVVLVRQALHALPGEQRQAIELAFLGGLTHSEIAAQLGEALGTIKARIRRGMMALRDVLEGNL